MLLPLTRSIRLKGLSPSKLLVFPTGNDVDHLSMYLDVTDSASLPYGWRLGADSHKFSLVVVNQTNKNNSVMKVTVMFPSHAIGCNSVAKELLKRVLSEQDAHKYTTAYLNEEIKGSWSDMLLLVLRDEWRNCKRAVEASSPQLDPKSILLPPRTCSSEDRFSFQLCSIPGDSSFAAGERMCEMVKGFTGPFYFRLNLASELELLKMTNELVTIGKSMEEYK
ncbi:uncharacterized protein A4U43_C05F18880 [Asparagus officinalis]|uniref:Uncharacterized protein n=1 Tax=Asparagus officinalis TaxID=4686 RepID=A0A5P1EX23_ASPOF|nr:uncharacterized protein A4U43_C05F18880 [Asparagus officinalis]